MTTHTQTTTHTDRAIYGRLHMTTETRCPVCKSLAVGAHIESHISPAKWYACSHLRAVLFDDGGFVEAVEFSEEY